MTPSSATATMSKPTETPTTNGSGIHAPNPAEVQQKLAEAQAAAQSQAKAADAQAAALNSAAALGQAVWLHMNVPAFKHMFLADLEWMVLPPILLGQFRITYDQGRPVSFAAWAYLSEAAEQRIQTGNPRLAPAEWKSGDRLWLVSVVAPFGHTDKALEDVKFNGLPGKSFKFHRRFPDGRAVVETVSG